MTQYRHTVGAALRSTLRRAHHSAVRTRWRAPDDLGTALACFRRAIRAHRRLARLGPRFFDSAVIERARREQEARPHWLGCVNAAFLKVYGAAPATSPPVPELPLLPSPRTQLAVERELASCRAWLGIGGDALRRFQVRQPHACMNLGRLARLIEVATALARLATGVDSTSPQTRASIYATAWIDLQRIYDKPNRLLMSAGLASLMSHK